MNFKSFFVFVLIFAFRLWIDSALCQMPDVNKSVSLTRYDFSETKNFNFNEKYLERNPLQTATFGLMIVMVVINPIVTYENKKFHFGLTRELTLGFGREGEFRVSLEYSYIFKDTDRHNLRISAKYDVMSRISRGDFISSRSVLTIGGGYFLDEEGKGIFPELTAGYRLGESDYILYPYIKLRHTFMLTKNKASVTDFSCGAILGIKLY